MNLPAAKARVCRRMTRVRHGTGLAAGSASLWMWASSPAVTPGCDAGDRYDCHQKASQMKPTPPVARKAHGHPKLRVSHGTANGAVSAPTLVPALKRPAAKARSFRGNHSAIALIPAGKFAASPRPSAKRAAMKPATDELTARPPAPRSTATAGP